MRLDRNHKGQGKYAVINLRKYQAKIPEAGRAGDNIVQALHLLERHGLIEYGEPGTEHEFFVLKLKDEHASAALHAYANSVWRVEDTGSVEDILYAEDVRDLAARSSLASPWCKKPD